MKIFIDRPIATAMVFIAVLVLGVYSFLNTPFVWKKNKLYSIEEDEEGFQIVKRYKVTWKY